MNENGMLACFWGAFAAVLITLIIAIAVYNTKADRVEQDVKKTAMEHGYVEVIAEYGRRYWTLPSEAPKPQVEKK